MPLFSCHQHTVSMIAISALTVLPVLPAMGQTTYEDYKLNSPISMTSPQFGNCVAVDNSIIAVGSSFTPNNNPELGSAYLYDASTGTLLFQLQTNDGSIIDKFGSSIAIDQGAVAVGALADTDNGDWSGAAYLFDASTGVQSFKLLPNDGQPSDNFGTSIAIDNGIVAVGSPWADENGPNSGAVYLFDASTGIQLFKLFPSELSTNLRFGTSIAFDNGIVAIGAPRKYVPGAGSEAGAVYLFDASTGAEISMLTANDADNNDDFGTSVAISNGTVAVGAPGNDDNGSSSGSAYLFDVSTTEQLFKFYRNDGNSYEYFGSSVAIDNGIVAVGAKEDSVTSSDEGSVYLFNASTGVQALKLLASDAYYDNWLGSSVAMDQGIIVAGNKPFGNNNYEGAAYVFSMPDPCPADLNGDWQLDFFDVSAFLAAFSANDEIADFTNDGNFDFFDVSAFLTALASDCP